jgi:hypothetical protein
MLSPLLQDGLIVFKLHRTPSGRLQNAIVVARRNPKALWITGSEDRIIYDGRKPEGQRYSQLASFLSSLFGNHIEENDMLKSFLKAV